MFDRKGIPIFICILKFIIEFGTEFVSLIFTAQQANVYEVIMNFIAMITISQIDQLYFNSLKTKLKDDLEEIDFKIKITN